MIYEEEVRELFEGHLLSAFLSLTLSSWDCDRTVECEATVEWATVCACGWRS